MSKIVSINDSSGITGMDINPDVILENLKGELKEIFYAGYDKNGNFVCGASSSQLPDSLWLIELAKKSILDMSEE